jgi:hypothetical protein
MSYGGSLVDAYRHEGIYRKILKGAKPAEREVKVELVLNQKTAKVARSHFPAHAARHRRRGHRVREGARQSWRDQPVQVRPR